MTRDEIIEMAFEAGVVERDGCGLFVCSTEVSELVEFAALVAAKEREACAQVCDSWADPHDCAGAIRARGQA